MGALVVMSIIRGRARLRALYDDPIILPEDIETIIVEELFRRKHTASPGTLTKNPTPTPEQVLGVRVDKADNGRNGRPRLTDLEIGFKNNIKVGGRVSEILYGDVDGNDVFDIVGERII
jgi:hypothetical protein